MGFLYGCVFKMRNGAHKISPIEVRLDLGLPPGNEVTSKASSFTRIFVSHFGSYPFLGGSIPLCCGQQFRGLVGLGSIW